MTYHVTQIKFDFKDVFLQNNSNSTHALIGHKTILHERM